MSKVEKLVAEFRELLSRAEGRIQKIQNILAGEKA